MQSTIVKLMSAPINGWMAICGQHSRFWGVVGLKS